MRFAYGKALGPQAPNPAKGLRPLTPCSLRAMKRNEALNRFKQKSLAKQGFFGYFNWVFFTKTKYFYS